MELTAQNIPPRTWLTTRSRRAGLYRTSSRHYQKSYLRQGSPSGQASAGQKRYNTFSLLEANKGVAMARNSKMTVSPARNTRRCFLLRIVWPSGARISIFAFRGANHHTPNPFRGHLRGGAESTSSDKRQSHGERVKQHPHTDVPTRFRRRLAGRGPCFDRRGSAVRRRYFRRDQTRGRLSRRTVRCHGGLPRE